MPLTRNECEQAVTAMSVPQQLQFLSILGHHLTVVARGAYALNGPGVDAPITLRAFNELHHRLYAQIRSLVIHGKGSFDAKELTALVTGTEHDTAFQAACLTACAWSLECSQFQANGGQD